MRVLILTAIIFCTVKTLSFFKWCKNEDKSNLVGNISVFLLVLGLFLTGSVYYFNVFN